MTRTTAHSGGRSRYYARYIAYYAKRGQSVLVLGSLFVAGVVLGTLLVRSAGSDAVSTLLRIVGGFVENRRGQGLSQNFFSGLPGVLGLAAALFVCGFCAIAQPIIVSVPLFRGLGFGFSAASLYAGYGAAATGYIAVFLLPGMLLSTLVLLLCCNEALRLSCGILKLIRVGRQTGNEALPVRIYCARYLVLAGLCVAAAFIEAVVFYAFAGSFML